jgi:hypothetical protein
MTGIKSRFDLLFGFTTVASARLSCPKEVRKNAEVKTKSDNIFSYQLF